MNFQDIVGNRGRIGFESSKFHCSAYTDREAMKYLLLGGILILAWQDQKLSVPSAADQKKTETEIRSIFKEDFAKKTRDGKRALAQKLLKEAADEKNTTVARYVVLLLSRDLAVEALDILTLFSAIDQMAKLYDVEKPVLTGATFTSSGNALKIFSLNNAQKFASGPEDSSSLGDAYLRVAEDTLKERLIDDALSAAQAAEKYGKSAKAAAVVERAGQLTKEIPELKKEDESFATVITSKADDPAARLVKGRYTLFVVGDEKAGIENLLECSDEGLKNVARLEAAKPSTAEAMVDVAEAWLALSGKEDVLLHKRRYKNRARGWFDEAMKNAGGITKAKVERRLAELGKSDGPASPVPAKGLVGQWLFDEGKGTTAADTSGRGNHGTLNGGVKWVSGVSGAALSFDGSTGFVSLGVSGLPASEAPKTVAWWQWVDKSLNGYHMMIGFADIEKDMGLHSLYYNGKLGMNIWGGAYLAAIDPPPGNQWLHLVYTFDGKTNRLYLNGELKDTSTVSPLKGAVKRFELGRWGGSRPGAPADGHYAGMLDEIRIYDRPLSDGEVRTLARKRK